MDIKGIGFLRYLRINAIVLWPFTIYAEKKVSEEVQKHEQIHWQQIRRDGVWRFYGRYLKEYFHHRRRGLGHDQAYRSISYEVEAYANQKNKDYRVS